VPGIALGFSRAQVEAAYGPPASCQSGSVGGDYASCSYPVEGGGKVTALYRGPNGGGPSNSPYDVVHHIRWEERVSGWTTTAGVNTALAKSDPHAVVAAYPNAHVTYTSWGHPFQVKDYELGITVNWHFDFYSGRVRVSMAISYPSDPPPPPEPVTRVTNINLYANKLKGKRTIWASVWVDDEYWNNAEGATVIVDWTYPDGSTQRLQAVTDDSGLARFEFRNVKAGSYTLDVFDVVYGEHRFDRELSTLSSSIEVR
jgi:hypothetical protein